jgi:hypothetical protein
MYRYTYGQQVYKVTQIDFFVLDNNNNRNKEITKTWLAGQSSCTLVIPKDFARLYGLHEPSHVVIEAKPEGILIRRLEV